MKIVKAFTASLLIVTLSLIGSYSPFTYEILADDLSISDWSVNKAKVIYHNFQKQGIFEETIKVTNNSNQTKTYTSYIRPPSNLTEGYLDGLETDYLYSAIIPGKFIVPANSVSYCTIIIGSVNHLPIKQNVEFWFNIEENKEGGRVNYAYCIRRLVEKE